MATTPALNITHLEANQTQPDVTVNEGSDIMSTAVADYLAIDFAADADYTFATGSGVQEWHHAQIDFTDTGVVLTTGRNVIVPDEAKKYIFINNTLQTLTIKTSAGAQTVEVLTTEGTYVRCDGSEVYLITAGGTGGGVTAAAAVTLDPATVTDADLTLSNGDLTASHTGASRDGVIATRQIGATPVYWEMTVDDVTSGVTLIDFLLASADTDLQDPISTSGYRGLLISHNEASFRGDDDTQVILTGEGRTAPTIALNDVVQFAVDPRNGAVWVGVNDTYLDSGNPATGANPYVVVPEIQSGQWYPGVQLFNTVAASFVFAADDWTHTAPTGFYQIPIEHLHRNAADAEDDMHPQYMDAMRGDERYLRNQDPQRLETDAEHGTNTDVYEPEGVETVHTSGASNGGVASQLALGPGKVYAEFEVTNATSTWMFFGLVPPTWTRTNRIGDNAGDGVGYRINGSTSNEGVDTTGLTTAGVNDIVSIATEVATGKFWFAINGVWESGDPALGTSPSETDTNVDETWFFGISQFQTNGCKARFRACDLTYAIPDGFTVLPNSTLHASLTGLSADDHPQYILKSDTLGDAVWREKSVSMLHMQALGLTAPTDEKMTDDGAASTGIRGRYFPTAVVTDLNGALTLPYDYDSGTDIEMYVVTAQRAAGTGNAVWETEYVTYNNGDTIGNATLSVTVQAVSGTIKQVQRTTVGTISGSGLIEGDIIDFRIGRDGGHASDTYGDGVYGLKMLFTYKADKRGTSTELPT